MILDGYDMPSILTCMKYMKENRESLYFKSQANHNTTGGTHELEYPLFTPQHKGDSALPISFTTTETKDDFSMLQRTKDEDWDKIFKIYSKLLALILAM